MRNKIEQTKKRMRGECEDITVHTVSARWYRMHVDMDYTGEQPVELVQCTYASELYANPRYMTLAKFNSLTPERIAEEWEI